ncbi:DUF1178 family protein [Derxia gummosa]|uniref:DUF1178 family protein n=1 Tax=Derxia gummosa DSM 723 TaxID=1121388 RepID=A0A8B6X459_9BURK|nr:DUF1178 family protein [Derxia gummosa]
MIVFNLACEHNHAFEGWFGSAQDFDDQKARGLLVCPVCESREITRRLSAPRLNLRGGDVHAEAPRLAAAEPSAGPPPELAAELHKAWVAVSRHIVANTEDVGDRFAAEARRIHHQEAPERNIRGTATPEQARELREEGIEVQSFPLAPGAKSTLQ